MTKLLKSHGMGSCNPAPIPLDPGTQLRSPTEQIQSTKQPYRSIMGALVYSVDGLFVKV